MGLTKASDFLKFVNEKYACNASDAALAQEVRHVYFDMNNLLHQHGSKTIKMNKIHLTLTPTLPPLRTSRSAQ